MSDKKEESPQPRKILHNLWGLIAPYKTSVRTAIGWIAINELLGLVGPLIMMKCVDQVVKQASADQANRLTIILMISGFILAFSFIQLASKYKNRWTRRVVKRIEFDIQTRCATKLLHMPLVYFQKENSGKLIGKLGRGVSKTTGLIWSLTFDALPTVASFIITITAVLVLHYQASFILLPALTLFLLTQRARKRRTQPLNREREDLQEDAQASITQAFDNIETVQVYCQERRECRKAESLWGREMELAERHDEMDANWSVLQSIILLTGSGLILLECALSVLSHNMTIGQLFLVFSLSERLFGSTRSLSRLMQISAEAEEPISRTLEILHAKDAFRCPAEKQSLSDGVYGAVEFNNVVYRYPKSGMALAMAARHAQKALSRISFVTNPQEVVAIVGPSGSGKSTILKLLMRMDDPTQGHVRLDGLDLANLEPSEIRKLIGYVGKPQLFNTTVAQNIAYGCPKATSAEIEAAATLADAHDFISRFPKGYQEIVGNDGDRLSDGQKQRIMLARALLLDPPILVLDEPWNHLDVQSAWEIKQLIMDQRGQRTIFLVTHDILGIERYVDRILVMDSGHLAEQGTHEGLMRKGGLYAILYQRAIAQLSVLRSLFVDGSSKAN